MPRNRRPRGPSAELRIYFMALCILLGFCGLVGKLWWEQVARGKEWTKKIANRSEVTVRIPSVRGETRDRQGITLVGNRASYEIDFKTIAKFSEHNVGLPGVDISVRPVRQYVYGALAAHLLGYVGAPNNVDQQPDVDKFTFYQPDVEGKSQIELSMDKYLRGKP